MRHILTIALTFVLLMTALAARPAWALNIEWDGDHPSDDWAAFQLVIGGDDITNWIGTTIPDADDTVLFGSAASNSDLTVDLDGDREVIEVAGRQRRAAGEHRRDATGKPILGRRA